MKKLILVVALALLIFSGCSQSKSSDEGSYVLKVNGEEVSKEEFSIYLYETQKSFEQLGGSDIWETDFDGRTAENVAKDNTFNTVVMVKIAKQKAVKEGIDIDDKTKEELEAKASDMYNGYSDGIRNEIGADKNLCYEVLYENALYNIVYEDTVKNYTADEKEFESYYSENKDMLIQYYKTNVSSDGQPDEETLKDYSFSYYENDMKKQLFSKEYDKWKAESAIEKNQDVWDKIVLIK